MIGLLFQAYVALVCSLLEDPCASSLRTYLKPAQYRLIILFVGRVLFAERILHPFSERLNGIVFWLLGFGRNSFEIRLDLVSALYRRERSRFIFIIVLVALISCRLLRRRFKPLPPGLDHDLTADPELLKRVVDGDRCLVIETFFLTENCEEPIHDDFIAVHFII